MSAKVSAVEREIIETIGAAGIRLRFDKVALRVIDKVKTAVSAIVAENQTVIFMLTAPIRLPSRTAAAMEALACDGFAGNDIHSTIHGNQIRMRRVTGVAAAMPRAIGFVHNPEADVDTILALAGSRLRGKAGRAAPGT